MLTLIQDSLPDGTQLIAWSREPSFKLEAIGLAESLAEIGEQIAWLGSALRSSPYQTGATYVKAFLSGMGTSSSGDMIEASNSAFFCNINFDLDVADDTDETCSGQCWHELFRSPVIVQGYPIPRRPISGLGLEISLHTMASLAGTRHVQIFNNKLFLKAFATMLIPTRQSNGIILWHLLYKKNGDRISYLDGSDTHVKDISLFDLETSRHIVGWTSKVRYLAGKSFLLHSTASDTFTGNMN
jgi:hypothetical protein